MAVQHVIERGNLEEWQAVQAKYGKEWLKEVVNRSRQLSVRDRVFALLSVKSSVLAPYI